MRSLTVYNLQSLKIQQKSLQPSLAIEVKIDFAKDILFQNGRLRRKLKMFRLEEKDRAFFDSFFVPKNV